VGARQVSWINSKTLVRGLEVSGIRGAKEMAELLGKNAKA
jgi:hypothetical protein